MSGIENKSLLRKHGMLVVDAYEGHLTMDTGAVSTDLVVIHIHSSESAFPYSFKTKVIKWLFKGVYILILQRQEDAVCNVNELMKTMTIDLPGSDGHQCYSENKSVHSDYKARRKL
jgi:hypothetical protein